MVAWETAVAKCTLNPTYTPRDATFDFPISLSLADKLGVVELVVWGKDMLTKVASPLDDWFVDKLSGKAKSVYIIIFPSNQLILLI